MIILSVVAIKDFGVYSLRDEKGIEYDLSLQFFGNVKIEIGDKFCLNEKYLNKSWPNFAQPYAFARYERKVFEKSKDLSDIEFIRIQKNDTKEIILLKRVYG